MKSIFIKYMFTFTLLIFIACPPDSTIPGCMDNTACNYNASATEDDGSCILPDYDSIYDCDGNCWSDTDGDGFCDELEIVGCQDSTACNYDALATDVGDCFYASDALPNPIEITYKEEEVSGSVGEDIGAKIYIRNASCEIMSDLVARKIFNAQIYPDDVEVDFCFGSQCYGPTIDISPVVLELAPFQQDERFTGYLLTSVPGVYEVNYRFYLESEPSQNTQVKITYTVN